MSLSEMMARVAYNRSGDVGAAENANKDWRDGYAVGYDGNEESMSAIEQEWLDRGRPSCADGAPFTEWKIGFWAGRFQRIDEGLKQESKP